MKKCIKFLVVTILLFVISMSTQIGNNKIYAYSHGDIRYSADVILRWNQNGYWVVDDLTNAGRIRSTFTIPEYEAGAPIKEIGDNSFSYTENLSWLNIPNTVETIGTEAFYNSSISGVDIPSSVKSIGPRAFWKCSSLTYLKLNEGLEQIGERAFYGCRNISSIVIPDTVTFIGYNAFNVDDGKEFTIYGSKNSVAEEYASKYDYITFKEYTPFPDVSVNSWYLNAVKYVYSRGIMTGLTDTKFGPNDKVTRGMFITILYKKEGAPDVSTNNQFVDVSSDAYYAKAVTWGVNNGIISGYNTKHFGPEDLITREQIAVILQQYCEYKGEDARSLGDLTEFSDYKNVSSYATWGMEWAVGSGVITGSNGKLLPKSYATRAEAAAMIQKYCYNFK